MRILESLVCGEWVTGRGKPQPLHNPATEEVLCGASTEGVDLGAAVRFARERGGPALRALGLAERGRILGEMAKRIHRHRDELLDLGMQNGGNTRSDAKFDVDGASATLQHYAELAAGLGDGRLLPDGDALPLGRSQRLAGRHVLAPRHGVALLVNAFNFPAWGFGEKAACALLAGMPVVVKPATSTAMVAHRMVQVCADAAPPGAVSLVCGSAHELPAMLDYGDVIAFTGSSATATSLRGLATVVSSAVRLNVEADSLNAAVLAPDVEPGSDTWDLFVRDVIKEMTQKTGQKCTAVRRIFAPAARLERLEEELVERLRAVVVGNPTTEGVTMGPVASKQQHADVRGGIAELGKTARAVLDGSTTSHEKGWFVGPTLLAATDAGARAVHELEVFGPVATIVAAPEGAEAELVARGRGGLVCSAYTDDRDWAVGFVSAAACHHGRVVLGSAKVAGQAVPPGTVMPQLVHGGPGRAGGGEELGGLRGVALYAQRVALQGDRALLDAVIAK
jgi:oxepin-CoA hydrolase/3-oxo-5,6-dehydrosuberyl-CoA semialdehyde dehydrogenase